MARPKLLLSVFVFLLVAAGAASAQTVSIVSGQGQISCTFCPAGFDPLVVRVLDANGAPLPNASVTWTVTGQSTISDPATATSGVTLVTTTDATGQSKVNFSQSAFSGANASSSVTAMVGTSSVLFYETTAGMTAGPTPALLIVPGLTKPAVGETLSGQAGTTVPDAIQVIVGVPNVAVQLTSVEGAPAANASCAATPGQPAGIVLSDANGIAVCNLVFGNTLGSGQFNISVGNKFRVFGPFNTEITAGLPCTITIEPAGNNQSGNAGQTLPRPLVATITDCGGNGLNAVPVTWGPVSPANGATLSNSRTSSDATGRVSSNVTLGSIPGAITIPVSVTAGTPTANGQPVSASFTATVNLTISGFTKVGGDNQEAAQNAAFPLPLTVQVNGNNAQPVANVPVNFVVSSGSAVLSAASATTNAQGQASVTATAGPTVGPVVVTATVANSTQTFSLTVRPPGPANVTFFNGAGLQANFIAPCSVAQITGSGLATGIQGAVVPVYFGPWSQLVAGVQIQFGNAFAPIYSVSNFAGQQTVTFQVPCETAPGNVQVTIKAGTASAQFTTQVSPVAPGIFETVMSDGRKRGVVVKPDGTFASLENPVRKGEIARMYVTGMGNGILPAVGTNSPGIPDIDSTVMDISSIIVGVNNAGVQVISARYARDLIGIYEVTFQVPSDVAAGDLNLAIAVNGVFGNSSKILVQ